MLLHAILMKISFASLSKNMYNPFLVYCRELAPGTVSLTCDRAQGDDSKHDSHYNPFIGGKHEMLYI